MYFSYHRWRAKSYNSFYNCICFFPNCLSTTTLTIIPKIPTMETSSARITTIYWIIITICKQIISNKSTRTKDRIRIDKSAPARIIVSALQIIPTGLDIIVISTVPERIVGGCNCLVGASVDQGGCGASSPCVVGIGRDFVSELIVDRNDIAMQILFKEIVQIRICRIRGCTVFQSDGRTLFIVQIDDSDLACAATADDLRHNLAAVEQILVLDVIDRLARANPIGVVGACDRISSPRHRTSTFRASFLVLIGETQKCHLSPLLSSTVRLIYWHSLLSISHNT